MEYEKIRHNSTQFLALTSLRVSEFDWLLQHFTTDWEKYCRYHTLEGKKRQIFSYKEHGNSVLKGTDTKLFFLLNYLKTNSLQEQMSANFGVSQGKISRISGTILQVLNQTLTRLGLSPVRNGFELRARLENHPSKVFSYDGVEREILRNADPMAQSFEYSGKKKDTALKT